MPRIGLERARELQVDNCVAPCYGTRFKTLNDTAAVTRGCVAVIEAPHALLTKLMNRLAIDFVEQGVKTYFDGASTLLGCQDVECGFSDSDVDLRKRIFNLGGAGNFVFIIEDYRAYGRITSLIRYQQDRLLIVGSAEKTHEYIKITADTIVRFERESLHNKSVFRSKVVKSRRVFPVNVSKETFEVVGDLKFVEYED